MGQKAKSVEKVNPPAARRWAWLVAVALPAVLYFSTLYPGPGGRTNVGDSAKFQYVGSILGVPHQPGYPQYVLLNHLWTRLPLPGELAVRVNAFSALFALAAGAILYSVFLRWTQRAWVSVLGVWSVLLAGVVWTFSTEAEVHSLHLFWVAVVVWGADRLRHLRPPKGSLTLAAVLALALGNHPIAIGLVPAVGVALLGYRRAELKTARFWALALVLACLGASQYGYSLWRSHSDAEFVEGIRKNADLGDLWRSMRGTRFTEQHLLKDNPDAEVGRYGAVVRGLGTQLPLPVWGLAVFGAIGLLRREPWLASTLGVVGGTAVLFVLVYRIGDWSHYVAPAVVAAVACAVHGIRDLARWGRTVVAVAALLWASTLGLKAVGLAQALHVEKPRYDRSELMTRAPDGARVVPYDGPSYGLRQLTNYYRWGWARDTRRSLEIAQADIAFERRLWFLDDRPLFFSDRKVKQWAQRFGTDFFDASPPGSAERLYRTGTVDPLERLVLRPTPDGVVLERNGSKALTGFVAGAEMVVVDAVECRVKGVLTLSPGEPVPILDRLRALFTHRLSSGDAAVFVVRGDWTGFGQVAAGVSGLDSDQLEGARTVVAVHGRGLRRPPQVFVDPVEAVTIPLGTVQKKPHVCAPSRWSPTEYTG